MLVILLNCVTLGMYQPCEDVDCSSDRCRILQAFDDFIFIFFAMEMVVKMVALGIIGKKCYLGDTWNRLDFFIVMSGIVEYSLDLQNVSLSAIRTVRVLRPLKAINRVPSMRILVNLLLDTLPMLGNVLLLCFFVFFIFGIIGVQLWAGLLRNRCFLEENLTLYNGLSLPQYYHPEKDDETPFICSLSGDNGIMGCDEIPALRDNGHECCLDKDDYYYYAALGQELNVTGGCVNWNRYYTVCQTGDRNPHKGAINFDNIGYAWIVIFQVITLEGWVEIMYYVMDAHSFYNFIYFILLIIVGSFFMINLCLVVIATQFSETKQREHQLMQEQRALYLSSSTVASFTEPGDCYEEMFQYVCHILRKARRRTLGIYTSFHSRRQGNQGPSSLGVCQKECGHCPVMDNLDYTPHAIVQPIVLSLTSDPSHCPQCNSIELTAGSKASDLVDTEAGAVCEAGMDKEAELERKGTVKPEGEPGWCVELWSEMRGKLTNIVESKYFNRGIMMAILINTISMGIEHHEQPEELTHVLEISNIVFTSMFALEMILKLTAFGFFNYLRNPYNIFDGIIVIISVCEIIGQSDGGLSVLRTFRLLRVLKLVRFMPALRRQLVVLMKTMDNVATFCMLLMLFIFIFSILGMHIFGCKFSLKTDGGDTVPDRKNFDSLLWAIVTVFQILTQEDWNVVLYNGMASTSPWAALYFVALMTFGNYVLFNLLVAILVEGFQAEGDANKSDSEEEQTSTNFEDYEKIKEIHYLSELKACSIAMTPNGHLDLSPQNQSVGSRSSLQPENPYIPAGSRKSSVTSLTRVNFDQKSLSSRRSSHYVPWGAGSNWGSRRTSWSSVGRASSLKHKPLSGEHEALLAGDRWRIPSTSDDPRDARPEEAASSNPLHRRALSLDTKGSGDLPELLQVPAVQPVPRKNSIATVTLERRDCNGKGPHIVKEIFPKMNNRKDQGVYDEEIDYRADVSMKVVSLGFYIGDQAYLRSSWNILDGFLVFVSLIDIVVSLASAGGATILGVLRVLRLLRTLRPLRVISRAPGLKLVVETLISSLKPIGNIVLICCAFFIIFGILGVQLFKGKFYYCQGHDTRNVTNRSDCLLANYRWTHHKYNFDNLGQALMSLFVLASKDGWVNIMYHGLDAVSIDQQPIINHNPWMLLYFISFLLIVSFFVLNMFVGVVVENFHKCRQHQEAEEARRREEKRLQRLEKKRRKAQRLPYYAAYSPVRLFIHTMCTSHYLDLFITFTICINVVTMSLEHYNQPKDTLRDCSNDDRGCFSNLQLISPLYFVSFVLTAQFVLINVVVAVLMKHLDDSNKEAQEDAELDAEIEMELAQGFCCQLVGPSAPGGSAGSDNGPKGHKKKAERPDPGKHISPAQENLWLDSVSLIIRDTFENELLMIDNLSGSIFHHYTSSPTCWNCHHDKHEVHLAETEAFSLTSDLLSDKSSSVVLADDLSSDDSVPHLPTRGSDEKEGTNNPSVPENGSTSIVTLKETAICRTNSLPNNSYISHVENSDSGQTVPETQPEPTEQKGVAPLQTSSSSSCLQFSTELFHPAKLSSTEQAHSTQYPKVSSSSSWALLQSSNMAWSLQRQVAISDTSLSDGSVDSLQTTLENSLRLAVSPQCTLALPMVCTALSGQRNTPSFTPPLRINTLQRRRGLGLQMMRGRQRSQSSGGSTSPGCTYQDSMDPSDEEGISHSLRANSDQSETLSSLSLTSLFSPSRSPPTPIKKCNSTGTLDAVSKGRDTKQFYTVDQQGFLTAPSWVSDFCRNNHPASGLEDQGAHQETDTEDVKIAHVRPSSQIQTGPEYNATMQRKKR
ncbi:voltage-dependent T-type calcium channel subunit alpha-1I [Rhincodon typus]|uniref:voltage-dependent T-type calcium channel subunit alpha-1I n=1 Tax=Rhincodon typus TaxID=259920 RepID=UPI00202F27F4|nr:voltage-dependent T-type calcium channel subunit alpha-1I [Rhincodon typus]